jgi:hypothetical protein
MRRVIFGILSGIVALFGAAVAAFTVAWVGGFHPFLVFPIAFLIAGVAGLYKSIRGSKVKTS